MSEINSTVSQNLHLSVTDVHAAREIKSKIKSLKTDMNANGVLYPLPDDGGSDVIQYNQELETLSRPSWHNAPWLYSECYMYRLMHTFFTMSTPYWQKFDMFVNDKRKALVGSKKGAIELVKRFREVLKAEADGTVKDESTQRAIFEEMVQICLWGNATDLSLLTSLSVEQLESRQGKAMRDKAKANVLVNDTTQVEELLTKLKSQSSSDAIHIVLDNAGFELLADLVFAGYLIESGYAKKIVLHGKHMPWFVSDVNDHDLTDLVEGFASGSIFPEIDPADKQEVIEAGKYWESLLKSGQMSFVAESFWTTAHSYGRMADVDPELFEQLAGADLVVYKGDLNYRKLTYDGLWPHSTSFREAMGPLTTKQLGGKGQRTFVLRTCKADVAVGLKPGQEKDLPGDWTRTGKYAVASYCDSKS